jgi:aspartate aminotransferase-like enzyme
LTNSIIFPVLAFGHSALLLVDAISSTGSIEYHLDEWEVDVTIAASAAGKIANAPTSAR